MMKKINNRFAAGLIVGMAVVFTLSACQKKFNPKSYAPSKPLPTYGGYSSSAEIEPGSLVDYFPFSGNYEDSLKGLTATESGSVGFGKGVNGQAFQGALNSYLVFNNPGPLKSLSSFTVAFWMNSGKTAGEARGIFSLNNPTDFWGSLDIYLDNPLADDPNGDTLLFKVHMNNASGVPYAAYFLASKVPNAINTWTHMVVTYDAGSSVLNIYQNAKAIGISGVAGTNGYVTGPTIPGSDPTVLPVTPWGPITWPNPTAAVLGTWQFDTTPQLTNAVPPPLPTWAASYVGLLDNFRVYSKALSSTEVNALYNLESQGR